MEMLVNESGLPVKRPTWQEGSVNGQSHRLFQSSTGRFKRVFGALFFRFYDARQGPRGVVALFNEELFIQELNVGSAW